jgi:hypothetical protein
MEWGWEMTVWRFFTWNHGQGMRMDDDGRRSMRKRMIRMAVGMW